MTMSTKQLAWPNHVSNGHAWRTTTQTKSRPWRVARIGNVVESVRAAIPRFPRLRQAPLCVVTSGLP
jgi:hypothetical protein